MKNLAGLVCLMLLTWACATGEKKTQTEKTVALVANADSIGMAETLHTFFKWYGETGITLIDQHNFVNTSAKHPTLDLSMLAQYLGEFSKSGVVSPEFIQNETIFYRACSLAWQDENSGELITGFDADRYYCQQDGDPKEFLTAGIYYEMDGEYAIVQLMLDPNGPNGGPRPFEMRKENGKWMLSKNGCGATLAH
jgi:hypothetical protein